MTHPSSPRPDRRGAVPAGLASGLAAASLAGTFDLTTLAVAGAVGAAAFWLGRRHRPAPPRDDTALERALAEYALDAPFGLGPETTGLADEVSGSLNKLHHHVSDALERATHAERARENAEFEAANAGRARSEFLATMSHELRTPLNGALGMMALLQESDLTREQLEFVQTARRSCQVLLEMIDEVLDFATLETDRLVLHRTEFPLAQAIWDTVYEHAGKAAKRGLGLSFHEEDALPHVVIGDPARFRQVLENVLSNALKFTHEGEVALRCRVLSRDDCSVRLGFELSDTGIGIPDDLRDQVFDAFAQGDQSSERRYEGAGLGLVIVRRLLELMDGDIDFVSEVGHGTTFRFELVLALPTKPAPVLTRPALVKEGTRAVVVTSHPSFAEAFSAQLERLGFAVEMLADPEEALHLRRTNPPVLFFVDDTLPNLELHQLRCALDEDLLPEGCADVLLHGPDDQQPHAGFHGHVERPTRPSALRPLVIDLLENAVRAPLPSALRDEPEPAPEEPAHDHICYEGRVLVVEDDAVNRRVVTAQLERRGIEVETATTGLEALAMLRLICCDLVLMDVQMPEMDGLEATRRIRGGEAGPHLEVPIIALTASDQPGDRAICCEVGMNDYIKKPLASFDLDTVLGNWLPKVTPADED